MTALAKKKLDDAKASFKSKKEEHNEDENPEMVENRRRMQEIKEKM
jgi:hypothetical protein